MKNYILILVGLFIFSCSEKPDTSSINELQQKLSKIVLTGFDQIDQKGINSERPISIIRKAYYYGQASEYGNFPDTINLEIDSDIYVYSNESGAVFKTPDGSSRIYIYVDTTKYIPAKLLPAKNLTSAYPVYIYNRDKEAVYIGSNDHLNLILEAKDSTGKWHDIEQIPTSFSEDKIDHILLPSKYYAVTYSYLYDGDFETDLRLKFKTDNSRRSNVFRGKINYDQFIK